jgi:hypothetical protein
MTFQSCFKEFTIWNLLFAGQEYFLGLSTKITQALCHKIRQENALKIG